MLLLFITGCGSFNEPHAELHINKNISTGQELLDIQAALDANIITEDEFKAQKERILSGDKIFEIEIDEFENFDHGDQIKATIRLNLDGEDVISIDTSEGGQTTSRLKHIINGGE
jgi:hypothetical protein